MADVLAIDLAILVPEPVAAAARDINRGLAGGREGELRLDTTHLPHVTLAQQFVERARLDDLWLTLDRLFRHEPPLPLRVVGATVERATVSFAIDPAPDLLRLHEAVADALAPFEAPEGGPNAFEGSGEAIRPQDVDWVRNYREQAAGPPYRPHVTLGHADRAPDTEPILFVATRLAACRLGRFCSCRTILKEWTLGTRNEQPL